MSWFGLGKDRGESRNFEVVIYENDYKQLCSWVLKKTNIETGGDLFGLWADKHTAVIQFVVGPGQGCRRTSVSFYQDINYLEKVGSYLTQKEGVCHIGEWHSHHQLGLARPSGGDENTVWNNMPTYNLKRFVIFIANIERSRQDHYNVNIGCFLFELDGVDGKEKQLPVLQGEFKILQRENPFNEKVLEKRHTGAEKERMDEKEIAVEGLKLEIMNGSPCVSCIIKSSPDPKKKRHTTPSGSSVGSKKKKTEDKRPPISDENTQRSENMSPDAAKTSEHLKDLNIDDDSEEKVETTDERKEGFEEDAAKTPDAAKTSEHLKDLNIDDDSEEKVETTDERKEGFEEDAAKTPNAAKTSEDLKDLNIDDDSEEKVETTDERKEGFEEDASGESQNDVSKESEGDKLKEEKDKHETNASEVNNEAMPPQRDQEQPHPDQEPRPRLPTLSEQIKAPAEETEIQAGDKNPEKLEDASKHEISQESGERKNEKENAKTSKVDKKARDSQRSPEKNSKSKESADPKSRPLPPRTAKETAAGKQAGGTTKSKAEQRSGKKGGSTTAGSKSKNNQRSK